METERDDRPGELERNRPVIGAPMQRIVVRYFTAKYTTTTLVRIPKNAVTPMMNQYSWSTFGAIVDACSGIIWKRDDIRAQACLSTGARRSRRRINTMKPRMSATVSAPPARTSVITAHP